MLLRFVATTTAAIIGVVVLFALAGATVASSLSGPGLGATVWGLLAPDTTAPTGSAGAGVSAAGLADIPADYLADYRQAAASVCPGLSWTVLAGIGKVESDHGRSSLPGVHSGANSVGAQGPMQFLPATFAAYAHPTPPGGAVPASPYDPADAITAAARMLCANGASNPARLRAAILAYNHSGAYVTEVLAQARRYAATNTTPVPDTGPDTTGTDPTGTDTAGPATARAGTTGGAGTPAAGAVPVGPVAPVALAAVRFARAHLGTPYVWGGNGTPGFDCSGLTHAAYQSAGVTLPRTAQTQADAGPTLPPGSLIAPGDLLFYGTTTRAITHVGIAVSPTQMIDAPQPGTTVRIDPIGRPIAHTRPATAPTSR